MGFGTKPPIVHSVLATRWGGCTGPWLGMACPYDRRGTSARKRLVSVRASPWSGGRQGFVLDAARLERTAGHPDAM